MNYSSFVQRSLLKGIITMKNHKIEVTTKNIPSQKFSLEQVKQLRTEANAKPKWGGSSIGAGGMSYVR